MGIAGAFEVLLPAAKQVCRRALLPADREPLGELAGAGEHRDVANRHLFDWQPEALPNDPPLEREREQTLVAEC
jgi:hypothetical protein